MSLYRKHRPQKFSDLLGQEHIKITLTNALSGSNFSHAYLFSGPKGSGKTTTARLLAKAINCTGRDLSKGTFEPCNKCVSCREITAGHSMDMIEIDAASNRGIDEIRDLRDKIRFAPTSSKYKVYIIDECHMLTKEAFNALLKTLEEPPAHAVFVMATTELHKVPATILSRTQVFDFKKAKLPEIEKLLKKTVTAENIKIDEEAIKLIARLSFGAFRDALSMLEQVAALQTDGRSKISLEEVQEVLGQSTESSVLEFVKLLVENDRKRALKMADTLYFEGIDLESFLTSVISVLRKLLLVKEGLASEFETGGEEEVLLKELSGKVEVNDITHMIEKLVIASSRVKTSILGQLPLEMAVFELTNEKIKNAVFLKAELIIEEDKKKSEPSALKANRGSEVHGQGRAERLDPISSQGKSRSVSLTSTGEQQFSESLWPLVFKEVKAHNNTLAAMLRDAQFAGTDDGQITLAVRFKFHAEQICNNKNRLVIEKAVLKVTGSPYKIDCIVDSNLALKKPQDAEEELLASTLEVFETEK